jgi:membrane protease YdiL (CAAX protease family)
MTSVVTPEHRLVRVVRRHPVGSFLAWSAGVGQAIAFLPVIARDHGVEVVTAPFVVAANLVGLLLPAVVITRIVDGREGVQALWRRTVRVRTGLRWYGLALVVVPLATTAISVLLLGSPRPGGSALVSALAAGLLVQVVLAFLTTNWWEEVAWTGFLQTRLQARHGAVRAALATGVLFGLQHVSLAVGNGWLGGLAVLLFVTAMAVPFRFLQGWVVNRTGSLFVVGLVHAAGNATTDGSGFAGAGLLPRLYPGEVVGPVHLVASAALGLLVLAATRGRLGVCRPDGGPGPGAVIAPASPGSGRGCPGTSAVSSRCPRCRR